MKYGRETTGGGTDGRGGGRGGRGRDRACWPSVIPACNDIAYEHTLCSIIHKLVAHETV